MTARKDPNLLSERDFQRTLVSTLEILGYTVNHVRPVMVQARGVKRWVTPTTSKGWPDLVAINARTHRLVAIECKADRTAAKVSDEQWNWLGRFHSVPGCVALVLRPADDWNLIVQWLRSPDTAPSGYGWLHFDPGRSGPRAAAASVD